MRGNDSLEALLEALCVLDDISGFRGVSCSAEALRSLRKNMTREGHFLLKVVNAL